MRKLTFDIVENIRTQDKTTQKALAKKFDVSETSISRIRNYKYWKKRPTPRYKEPLYRMWYNMILRCSKKEHKDYKYYGERGISVFEPWNDLWVFKEYIEKTLGPKPSIKHSLDRIDNNAGYFPGNIRWADKKTQNKNRNVKEK